MLSHESWRPNSGSNYLHSVGSREPTPPAEVTVEITPPRKLAAGSGTMSDVVRLEMLVPTNAVGQERFLQDNEYENKAPDDECGACLAQE